MLHAAAGFRGKIMIADENPGRARLLREHMHTWGLDADIVGTGLQVLHRVRQENYALIIMNTELPEMSGVKAAHILRVDTRFHTLPLIACLSEQAKEDPEALVQGGFTLVLSRPLDLMELETALQRVLAAAGYAPQEPSPITLPSMAEPPLSTASAAPPSPALPVVPLAALAVLPVPAASMSSAENAEELLSLPGFDCAKGLRRVMGNRGLYKKLLINFRQELEICQTEMRSARTQGKDAVRALIHKLKGISGNLGAEHLYRQTLDFEALLQQRDLDSCLDELDIFMLSVQETGSALDTLSFLFVPAVAPDTPSVHASVPAKPPFAAEKECRAALEETLSLIQQCDTTAQESFARLCSFLGDPHSRELTTIKDSLEAFDFDLAEEQLTAFARTSLCNSAGDNPG